MDGNSMTLVQIPLKGTVHFEMHVWFVLAYLKGIQDVGVFVFTVFSILKTLPQSIR